MRHLPYIAIALLAALAGCTTRNDTNPPRSATEEMLISTAADRAAAKLALNMPADSKVFIDSSNFEGTDSKYAVGAIRTAILRKGADLVSDRKKAQVVIEARSGALSIDQKSFLIGIPAFNIPVPLTSGSIPFPELAIYKNADQKGVAKFAVTGYDPNTGKLVDAQDPQYGFADNEHKTVLFLISWSDSDAIPAEDHNEDENDATRKISTSADQPGFMGP